MLWILCLLCLEPPKAILRDETTIEGRSALFYRSLEWSAQPVLKIEPSDPLAKESKSSTLPIGSSGSDHLNMIWQSSTATLAIDLNSDGKISEKERFNLTSKPIEITIQVDGKSRTLMVRLRGDDPVFCIRGFIAGEVEIAGKNYNYRLLDGDGDGCFHRVGVDRLWVDLDGDGKFDPLTEQVTVGSAMEIKGVKYILKPNAAGDRIEVTRRPDLKGEMEFVLTRTVKAKPSDVQLSLVSEWGEWIPLTDIEKVASLPAGKYRLERLSFSLPESKYNSWSYSFYNSKNDFNLTVTPGEKTKYELLPGLKLQMSVELPEKGLRTGDTVMTRPRVVADNFLSLHMCSSEKSGTIISKPSVCEIDLNELGSLVLDKTKSTIQCGQFTRMPVQVPAKWTGKKMELVVKFPTGPLAGDLIEIRDLQIREQK